jgi:hypothetical protein
MQEIRSLVVVLAVASASAPLLVLGVLVAAPFFLGTPMPSPAGAIFIALGAFAVVTVVRTGFSRRLTSTEQAIVRFWSLTPPLVVPIASTLGALPFLLLHALGVKLGPGAIRTVVALLLLFSALVLWQVWLRFRASLPGVEPRRGAA